MSESANIRLNKYLALQLGISRREADELIAKGRVNVSGQVASLGAHITTDDIVQVDNQPVFATAAHAYLLLNKPVGYVCSRKKQGNSETIYALLPAELHHLKTVGRLDKDSSGLLLLTNDGDFAHRMTHPSFHKQKTYEVTLDKGLEPLHQQMISDYGVQLDDGPSKLQLERLSDQHRTAWRVLMHEGRNRQIRRTFAALGYEVKQLHRTQFGDYALGDIAPGAYSQTNIS